ncbi:MAG: hypothetical protein ACPG6L_10830, partial [Nereida ignava]
LLTLGLWHVRPSVKANIRIGLLSLHLGLLAGLILAHIAIERIANRLGQQSTAAQRAPQLKY